MDGTRGRSLASFAFGNAVLWSLSNCEIRSVAFV